MGAPSIWEEPDPQGGHRGSRPPYCASWRDCLRWSLSCENRWWSRSNWKVRWSVSAKKRPEGSWFVIDAPIGDVASDAFGHDDIADNLHRMVTEPTNHRRMIGLLGQFGVGKSTIIELLRGKLKGDKNFGLIRVSAERHEPVGFHRAAVYAFAEALVAAQQIDSRDADEILEPLRSAQSTSVSDFALSPLGRLVTRIETKLSLSRTRFVLYVILAVLAAGLLVALLSAFVPPNVWTAISGFVVPVITTGAFFAPFLWLSSTLNLGAVNAGGLLASGARVTQRAKVEAADEQEQAFADLVAKAKTRLVVAVDDIDRLSKDQILAALNAIRSFQLTCKKEQQPIFIVSIDEETVRSAIQNGNGASTPDAHEYLNRLFTLRQVVPVHETFDLRDYARTSLTQQATTLAERIGDKLDDVIMMLIHDDVNDPRHVVRLINAFSSDYRLAHARELRTGARSLRDGLVTRHLEVLARVVVLKTDYPEFFRAVLSDVDLIEMAARASSLDAPDSETTALREAGFDPADSAHAPLYRYLARTAGWGPEEVDFVPFLYLGQDRFSQALGNVQARRLRQALANNQAAELARLADEAQKAGPEATSSFQELVVSVLRNLVPAEQNNGVAAILASANVNEALRSAEIGRVVAAVVGRRPNALTDVRGALAILAKAPASSAKPLARAILDATDEATDSDAWKARDMLSKAVGADRFDDWMSQRIEAIDSWERYSRWHHDDLDNDAANLLLWRAVELAATVSDELAADEDDLARVENVAASITEPAPVADDDTLKRAVGQPADTYGCAIALAAIAKLELTSQQLSVLSFNVFPDSAKAVDEDSEPLEQVRSGAAALAVRTATEAPNWGRGEGATRVTSASATADVIAGWIEDETFAASAGLPVLSAMVQHGANGQQKLAVAIFTAWSDDTEGADSEGIELAQTATELARLAGTLDPLARTAIHDKWIAMFGVSATPEAGGILAPTLLASDELEAWADDAITALTPWFSTSYDFAGVPTNVAARIMGTGLVTIPIEKGLLNALVTVAASGGSYRQRALSSVSKLPWSTQNLPEVTTSFERYVGDFEINDFWILLDLQILREEVADAFVARADEIIEQQGPDKNSLDRVNALVAHLELDNAITLALASGSAQAVRTAAARSRELTDEETPKRWAGYLEEATDASVAQGSRTELATALASFSPGLYAQAIHHILDETLDSGAKKHAAEWLYITFPLEAESRREIHSTIQPLLVGSTRDALAAAIVLHASRTDKEFDRIAAESARVAMGHWISEEPDPQVAAAIAAAVRGSSVTSGIVLSAWKRKPRIPERAAAYQAAHDALRR